MSRNPMLAIGVAGALALGAVAAQAQGMNPNSNPNSNSNSNTNTNTMTPPPSMNRNSGMAPRAGKADQKFLREAIEGDLAEVQMGRLARQNGQSEDVKQFGEMLESDHGRHLQQAQQQAQAMGVTPPTAPSAKHQSLHDKLSREHGARFDRQFAREMVKDHRKDIAEYQKEAKSKRPLAQFAQETIPTLQKHLRTAQSIESKGAMTGSKAGAK